MPDEASRKKLALDYCRLLNAGDVDGVVGLFTEDVRFEDPIGAKVVHGREALRPHLAQVVRSGVVEVAGEPSAASDGTHVTLPVLAAMDYLPVGAAMAAGGMFPAPADPERKKVVFHLISIMKVAAEGRICEVRTFWGASDVDVLDAAEADRLLAAGHPG